MSKYAELIKNTNCVHKNYSVLLRQTFKQG